VVVSATFNLCGFAMLRVLETEAEPDALLSDLRRVVGEPLALPTSSRPKRPVPAPQGEHLRLALRQDPELVGAVEDLVDDLQTFGVLPEVSPSHP
jgi:hypothetical protein